MRKTISVAMAVYNGEKYLKAQIDSILKQLNDNDEIIVSIDPSIDNSQKILESYQDSRIKIIFGPGQGVVSNFENALKHTNNEILFLCDQDDIWCNDKVEKVLSVFEKENVNLVLHDAKIIDKDENIVEQSFFEYRGCKKGIFNNILKNSYIGCCMALKKELKQYILPFPKNLPMHDQWIGLVAEKKGKVFFLKQPLLLYRRHDANASSQEHAGILQMVKWRLRIIWTVCLR